MSKPTPDELKTAIAEAIRLREQGEDVHFLAKTLLNHNYRLPLLEDVLLKTKRYLHSGQGPVEHTELLKAIEKAERSARVLGEEPKGPGF